MSPKYESRGLKYLVKESYKRGYEEGRLPTDKFLDYHRLTQGEFRLLELLPGLESSEIRCRLYRVLLGILLRYEALSYTWGDDSDPDLLIVVDQKQFLVKKHLKYALVRFRPAPQGMTSDEPADAFLRLWERICLVIDLPWEAQLFTPNKSAEIIQSFGAKGQADCEKYDSLIRERGASLGTLILSRSQS